MKYQTARQSIAAALLASIITLGFCGCHKSSSVAAVQNGLLDIDTRKTVGEAFGSYPYFHHVQWREVTNGGQTDVFAVAKFDAERVFHDLQQLPGWRDMNQADKSAYEQNKSKVLDQFSAVQFEFAFRLGDSHKEIFYRRLTVSQDSGKTSGDASPEGQRASLKEVYDGRFPTYVERAVGLRQPGDFH